MQGAVNMADNEGKKSISDKPEYATQEEMDALLQSYKMHVQFGTSLERSIEAFSLAAGKMLPEDSDKIREILACLADQFSPISQEDKESSMNTLKRRIEELASIRDDDIAWNKEINHLVCSIFRNLSEILPTSKIRISSKIQIYRCGRG